jgi:hypothetical protein
MTLPLFFNAVNAIAFVNMETTPEVKLEDTELEFPPLVALPHVTTLPSIFSAANAAPLEYTDTISDVKLDATEIYVLLFEK